MNIEPDQGPEIQDNKVVITENGWTTHDKFRKAQITKETMAKIFTKHRAHFFWKGQMTLDPTLVGFPQYQSKMSKRFMYAKKHIEMPQNVDHTKCRSHISKPSKRFMYTQKINKI